MASKQKPRVAAQEAPRAVEVAQATYFIVNARGVIHEVVAAEVPGLLARPGWCQATAEEVAELARRGGNQTADDPIVKG